MGYRQGGHLTPARDQRSAEAELYRKLYATAQWQWIRKDQLRRHPLCKRCEAKGHVVAATICNHDDPASKASPSTFFQGPFSSLCKPCHDGPVQAEERTGKGNGRIGYSSKIGVDGLPTDPRHPFNGG